MFDPVLRPMKDRALAPVARVVGGAAPGTITALGLAAGLAAAWSAWNGAFGLGLLLWLANRVLDGLDGVVARIQGSGSDLGGLFDLMADFTVYAAIPLAMALRPGAPPELAPAALVLLAAFYVNAASWMVPAALLEKGGRGAAAREESTSLTMPEGLVAGGETIVFYALFFLFPARQVVLFGVMAGLTAAGVIQRLIWARRVFGGFSGAAFGTERQKINDRT